MYPTGWSQISAISPPHRGSASTCRPPRFPPTVMPWPRLPRRSEPTRGHGYSAVARTTRWSPRSPRHRRTVGVRSAECSTDRRASWWTATRGAEIRVGSRSDPPRPLGWLSVTARPLNELVDTGWAQALEPVAPQVAQMGEFLRAELAE